MKYRTERYITLLLVSLSFLLSSSRPKGREVELMLQPMFGSQVLIPEKQFYALPSEDTVIIDQLRFYLSSVCLYFDNGNSYREKKSFHLVDFSAVETTKIILSNVPPGKITSIRFLIGVDSVASVSGALDGDLDPSKGMYWAWNSGYINAKMEGRSSSCKTSDHRFEFHIGGYLPPYQSVRPVQLPLSEVSDKITLTTDAAVWFTELDLSTSNSILVPGQEATRMADRYVNMFKITNVNETKNTANIY